MLQEYVETLKDVNSFGDDGLNLFLDLDSWLIRWDFVNLTFFTILRWLLRPSSYVFCMYLYWKYAT